MFQYFQLASLVLNLFLCVDLILTLRDPFYPSKRRVKFYLMFSLVIVAVLVFLSQGVVSAACRNTKSKNELLTDVNDDLLISEQASNLVLAMSLSIYIIVALYSCVYA